MMRARTRNACRRRGFTLVELLIGAVVLSTLLALAVPSVRDFMLMQRLKGIHAQIVTDLQLARGEAMSSGLVVNFRLQAPPLGSTGAMSCYVIFNDTARNYALLGASGRCDCTRAEGSRCTLAGTREIRTVQIPADRRVRLSLPPFQTQAVAFDPSTGGMMLLRDESGNPSGNPYFAWSSIDTARRLAAEVGLSGRPKVCRPTGSTMNEEDC